MTLIYPDGAQFNFVERTIIGLTGAGLVYWSPETGLTDKLVVDGDGFRLDQRDGAQCFFKKRGTASAPFYLMICLRGRALILDMIPITDRLFAVAFEQI